MNGDARGRPYPTRYFIRWIPIRFHHNLPRDEIAPLTLASSVQVKACGYRVGATRSSENSVKAKFSIAPVGPSCFATPLGERAHPL
jgi:hypothetical protein